jgi:hypothetical protein
MSTMSAAPRMQLPRALRARERDGFFAVAVAFSVLLHAGLVIYLRSVDWPRQPEVVEIDPFVRLPPAIRPAPVLTAEPAPGTEAAARPTPSPSPSPSPEDQRRRLVARVGRSGLLQVLSALGPQSALRDLLGAGSVDRDQEEALRAVGGLTVAVEGTPLAPLAPGPAGRVAEVTALRGQPHIATVDVGPGRGERRVPVVRVERADSEPVAGFDPNLLARTIRQHLAQLRACYERALKRRPDGVVGGKLVLRLTLTAAGTVAAVDVDEDTLDDPEVAACARIVAMGWRFPAPPRQVEVTFPFVFQPGS